jgi:hypothetical protein
MELEETVRQKLESLVKRKKKGGGEEGRLSSVRSVKSS